MRDKTESIIVHCSATREDQSYTAEDCRRDHVSRGWDDIGYHFYIEKDGKIVHGRHLFANGAHAYGNNSISIGVCYEGGLDKDGDAKDTRTDAQKDSLLSIIGAICLVSSGFGEHHRIKKIVGHRDVSSKECPCFDANDEYQHLIYA